jgi:hypothetical protein
MSDSTPVSAPPRRPWYRAIAWAALGIEALSTIFSVLFALAIDDWRSARADQQRVLEALWSVRREVVGNGQVLIGRMGYFGPLRDTVQALIARRGMNASIDDIPGWKGFPPPILGDAAYETAIATEAFQHMDYRLAASVSRVFAFQGVYTDLFDKALDRVIEDRVKSLAELSAMVREVVDLSCELLTTYQQLVTEIDAELVAEGESLEGRPKFPGVCPRSG